MPLDTYLTVPEVADILEVTEHEVSRLCFTGEIDAFQDIIGDAQARKWLISPESMDRYFDKKELDTLDLLDFIDDSEPFNELDIDKLETMEAVEIF